jgi:hypothetical protein
MTPMRLAVAMQRRARRNMRRLERERQQRRHAARLRDIEEREARGEITERMVVRRAIELFRNSNAFLRTVEGPYRAPGDTILIRMPST